MRTLVPHIAVQPRKRSADLSAFLPPGFGFRRGGASLPAPHFALRNAAVHSCVKILVESISSLPIRLVDRTTKADAFDHPVYALLQTPNDEQTGLEFFEMYLTNLVCHGNAFAEKVIQRGKIAALLPMNSLRTTVERKSGILQYSYYAGNSNISLPGELVMHTRLFGHDDLTGCSPLWAAERAIVLAMKQEDMLLDMAEDGGVPPLMIQIPPEKLIDRLENNGVSVEADDKTIQAQIENARTRLALYLPHGYEGSPLATNFQQLQLQESRDFAVAEIARIFRVPLSKLGTMSKADSAASAESQQLSFFQDSLRPIIVKIEKRLERDLLSPEDRARYQIKFNTRAFLRGDIASQTEQYARLYPLGIYTRNEVREWEDLPPFDDEVSDLPLTPTNLTTEHVTGTDQLTNPADGGVDEPAPIRSKQNRATKPLSGIQRRSLDKRLKAARSAKPLFRTAIAKILRKERATVIKDAKTILGQRSKGNLEDRLKQLYAGELRDFIQANITTPVEVLFGQIRDAMQEELGTGFDEGELRKIVKEYIRIFTRDYANNSLYTLLDRMDAAASEAEIADGLDEQFDDWEEGTNDAASRIDRESDDEPNRGRNVFAKALYGLAGISMLRFVASPTACSYCDQLDGATFSAKAAPQVPLHNGCECSISS